MKTKQLHVGQLNVPDRKAVMRSFEGIFDRRFFTNHGPLVAEFEERIARRLGVKHAICVTNGTVALMVAMEVAGLSGKVVVPAFTFPATVQAITYAGLQPVFCDVDSRYHCITAETVRVAMEDGCSAILGVRMWGRGAGIDALSSLAQENGLELMLDSAHAFGCVQGGVPVGSTGLFEVFSFHATKVLNCTEGGCVTTNDDNLAAAIRTSSNFHDRAGDVSVPLRINAKMSEAQAAMGLLGLERLDEIIEGNRHRYNLYRRLLSEIPGIRFFDHAEDIASNYQYVVIEVQDSFPLSQHDLMRNLKSQGIFARRYFFPGMHEAPPYNLKKWSLPVTDDLCCRVLQLPSGEVVSDADIEWVCRSIADVSQTRT